MNTPFGNSITTAEHAIAMMFACARQIPAADASTQAGKWEKSRFMGTEITGKTLGLIGAGNIGSVVAARAIGLKMKVIAYDPFLSAERAQALGIERIEEVDDLLARADFVTLHVPKTEKTANIISAERVAQDEAGRPARSTAPAAAWSTRRRSPRRCGPATSPAPPSTSSPRSRPRRTRSSARRTSSAPRTSAPRPPRRRRTSRCRSPSRCPTTWCTGAISNALNAPSRDRRGGADPEALDRARRDARQLRRAGDRAARSRRSRSSTSARSAS